MKNNITRYEGVVVDNVAFDNNDSIQVYVPELVPEYDSVGIGKFSKNTVITFKNMNSGEKSFKISYNNENHFKTITAYPNRGTGSQSSGSIIVPDKGDRVWLEKVADTGAFYYTIGCPMIAGHKEIDKNPYVLKLDLFKPLLRTNVALEERYRYKVLHQTKSKQGLMFSEDSKNKQDGFIVYSKLKYLQLDDTEQYIELMSDNIGNKAYGLKFDQKNKKIMLYNGSGITYLTAHSDGTFLMEVSDGGKIKYANLLTIEGSDVHITGNVVIDGTLIVHKTIDADQNITSKMEVSAVSGGVNLTTHTHIVPQTPSGATTSAPGIG